MLQDPLTPDQLGRSVIAVPPLARNADDSLNRAENLKLVRHLETGGVSTLLYGGNAILYHVPLSEYGSLLELLVDIVAADTLVIPSVGPSYGMMMDQAPLIRELSFPTSMVLPQRDVATSAGVAVAVRRYVEAVERPAVLYIKHDGFMDVEDVRRMMQDGLLSWIKYAIVRDDPAQDDFLRSLVDAVGPERIVSGIGEQPAIVHLRDFGLAGFTSGCVCVAPRLSMEMLRAVQAGDFDTAEKLRGQFQPLEDLRNAIHPIRVLHRAVDLAGLAQTGPMLPLLNDVDESDRRRIQTAANQLLELERSAVA